MGLPLPHGKLAIWLFLVTEIMFFTAMIGTYAILRQGTPSAASGYSWPTPHAVHLNEAIGAFNTFVLIASSLTVVLAHYAATKRDFKKATKSNTSRACASGNVRNSARIFSAVVMDVALNSCA